MTACFCCIQKSHVSWQSYILINYHLIVSFIFMYVLSFDVKLWEAPIQIADLIPPHICAICDGLFYYYYFFFWINWLRWEIVDCFVEFVDYSCVNYLFINVPAWKSGDCWCPINFLVCQCCYMQYRNIYNVYVNYCQCFHCFCVTPDHENACMYVFLQQGYYDVIIQYTNITI